MAVLKQTRKKSGHQNILSMISYCDLMHTILISTSGINPKDTDTIKILKSLIVN